MRKLYFLFPAANLLIGGHLAQKKLMDCAETVCSAEVILYGAREEHFRHLEDVLASAPNEEVIFVIHWGPHVQYLLQRLIGKNVVYTAYSVGWDIDLPPNVPIIAGSQYTAGYWGRRAPRSPIYNVPHVVSELFSQNTDADRDLDVLIQVRKSSRYLLYDLVPMLDRHCNLFLVDSWVPDLPALFRRSKVYVYDSVEFWVEAGVTEGLGLPPLEALAAGCQVFSSVNDGLSTYIDPGVVGEQVGVYSVEYDTMRVLEAARSFKKGAPVPSVVMNHTADAVTQKLAIVITDINRFFDFVAGNPANVPDVQARPTWTDRKRRISRYWRHKALQKTLTS